MYFPINRPQNPSKPGIYVFLCIFLSVKSLEKSINKHLICFVSVFPIEKKKPAFPLCCGFGTGQQQRTTWSLYHPFPHGGGEENGKKKAKLGSS